LDIWKSSIEVGNQGSEFGKIVINEFGLLSIDSVFESFDVISELVVLDGGD
jgi:hypothetical protein